MHVTSSAALLLAQGVPQCVAQVEMCPACAVAVLLMALYPLLPESPHYLAVNGRLLEAQDVLHRISHWNGRPLPPGQLAADKPRSKPKGELCRAQQAAVHNKLPDFSKLPKGTLCSCAPLWISASHQGMRCSFNPT